MAEAKVKAAFSELGIAFEAASHEPVTTVEAGLAAVGGLDCVFAKNLFVKDKKAGCFLLTVAHDTAVNMKSLPALLKTATLQGVAVCACDIPQLPQPPSPV